MSKDLKGFFKKSDVLTLHDLGVIADKTLLILSILLFALVIGDFFFALDLWFITEILYAVLWIAFVVEFVAKIIIAKDKLKYIRKEFFVIFIIIFPFLRPLRLFPASRWALVMLVEQVGDRFPIIRRLRVLEILLVSSVLVILSADLFLLFETGPDTKFKTFSDAIWFSVVSVATVGYGEIYPQTTAGRILASVLIIFGFSVFGLTTATISSYFVEQNIQSGRRREKREHTELADEEDTVEVKVNLLLKKIDSLEKQVQAISKKD
jgi:voltage-gated potassium channel